MSGPWEQYQNQEAGSQPEGPWSQYQAKKQPKEEAASRFGSLMTGIPEAEVAATLATGAGSSVLGGLAGIGATLSKAAGLTNVEPAEVVKDIQQRLTYQPRTELGKQGVQAVGQIATLGGLIPAAAEKVGGAVQDITGSPLAATAAHVATEAIPQILGAKGATLASPAAMRAASAVAGTAERAVSPLFERFITKEPEALSGVGAAETPAATMRIEAAKSLPVPIDLRAGQATRDFMQSQFERETAKTQLGAPIRESDLSQNAKILQNFDALVDESGGRLVPQSELGKGILEPIVRKAENAKSRINELYDAARRQGDMSAPVDSDMLLNYVNSHAPESINAPIITTVGQKLKQLGAAADGPNGELVPTNKQLSLNEIEEVRKMINRVAEPGTPNALFGKEMKSGIDTLTEGKGGDLYKAARAERMKYAQEFENQGAIANLLRTKPGTSDRAVAYEDIWNKSVIGGSKDDLSNLLNTLDSAKEMGGALAKQDIQAATIDYLKDAATKNMQIDELGNRVVSPAGLQTAMRAIGNEKLELLFGKQGTEKLRNLQSVIESIKTSPPGTVNASGTTSAFINALDRVLSALPGGGLVRGSIGMLRRASQEGSTAKRVQEAVNPPWKATK